VDLLVAWLPSPGSGLATPFGLSPLPFARGFLGGDAMAFISTSDGRHQFRSMAVQLRFMAGADTTAVISRWYVFSSLKVAKL
jgi:hypothetical protein